MTFNHFSQTTRTSSRDEVSKSWREGSKDISKREGITKGPDNRNQITKYINWINQIVPN